MTTNNLSRRQFLKAGGIGLLGAHALRTTALSNQNGHKPLFVGTYTTDTNSEGIYSYYMGDTGGLMRLGAFKSNNPSFLTVDSSKRFLYAVNELGEFGGKPGGGVSAFAIDPSTRALRLLNEQPSLGADPCHLTLDRKRRALLVANYTGGNVSAFPIRADGTLGPSTDLENHQGSGPKEQQKGPHAHCIMLDPSERYALAADLGIDKVMIYKFNAASGKLEPGKQPFAQLKAGAGPRHLTFHPNGRWVYVINELDSTMTVLHYNKGKGTLTELETVSTLPADFSGVSYCADVHVSHGGRFLYGSNRGHNSIVVFEIDRRTGKLKLVQHMSTGGDWPRNFAIEPYGRYLLVANQRSNTIVTLRINSETGELSPTNEVEQIPAPVCIRFF